MPGMHSTAASRLQPCRQSSAASASAGASHAGQVVALASCRSVPRSTLWRVVGGSARDSRRWVQYVVNFPPGEKYVSLLVDPEAAADVERVAGERARLRGMVRALMSARAEASAERQAKLGKKGGAVLVAPAEGVIIDMDPEDIGMIVFDNPEGPGVIETATDGVPETADAGGASGAERERVVGAARPRGAVVAGAAGQVCCLRRTVGAAPSKSCGFAEATGAWRLAQAARGQPVWRWWQMVTVAGADAWR